MSNYIGKICPFCKTEIKEGDDIVVCSSCDMPHHKDCWIENQGCTTFGCMGTIKAADGRPTTVTATELVFDDAPAPAAAPTPARVFCTKCGAPCEAAAAFCGKCGNPLRAPASAPTHTQANPANQNPYAYTQPNYNPQPTYSQGYQQNNAYGQANYFSQNNVAIDAEVAMLVGVKQEYYIPKFRMMKAQNKKTSWNWAAFLVAPWWLIYRKMYNYGAAALGILFLVSSIAAPFFSILALGGYVAMGIFADYLYMQWLEKNAAQIKMMNEPFRTQFVQKTGGVNANATALAIVGWIVLMGIIGAI